MAVQLNLAGATANQTAETKDRPKAKKWLNIGYYAKNKDGSFKTNEAGDRIFVSLPTNVPLDTMKRKEVRGKPDFRNLMQASNALLDGLLGLFDQIPAGGQEELNADLVMVLMHQEEVDEGDPDENPLIIPISSLARAS